MPRLQVRSPGQGTHKNQPGGTTNWCFSFSLLPSLKSTYVNDPISKQTQAQAHSEVLGVRTSICEFPGDTVQPITLPSETRHIPQRETSPAFSRKPPRPEQWGGTPLLQHQKPSANVHTGLLGMRKMLLGTAGLEGGLSGKTPAPGPPF